MPLPLSSDLRWRVVWLHYYKEISYSRIADLLYIHASTVRRIIAQYDSTGDVAPRSYRHGPMPMLRKPEEFSIVESILANPGTYLEELQEELYKNTGTWASVSTICRAIHRLGFTRKKLRHLAIQQSELKRKEFMEEMEYINPNMIVWLDETGSDRRNERRKFGYHLRGMTPTEYKFTIRGKRLSSIAIMTTRGIEDVDTFEGSINGDIFCDFIVRSLVPLLKPFDGMNARSIVVMDNASIHHVDKVINTILATGAILRFLPPYSPDFNPLEESFAKVKAFLKANEAAYDVTMSPQLLITMAFNTVITEDCLGYIRHAGYNFD